MKKNLFFLFVFCLFITGCGGVKSGEISNAGVVQYPLCEKAKGRIVDMQRASFELPSIFKQVSCGDWLGFSYSTRSDSVSASVSGVVANDTVAESGAVQTLRITGGYEMNANYLTPDVFFVDYKEYLNRRVSDYKLVTASWVSWSGGRCARFSSDRKSDLYSLYVVDYFCWEHESATTIPIHLHATQKRSGDLLGKNLDEDFIEPVFSTLKVNPVPAARLDIWSKDRSVFCESLKTSYEEKKNGKLVDDLDRRRALRFLRNCGYKVPEPVGIENWREIFMPDGQLVGQSVDGDITQRRLPREKFIALKEKIISLQPERTERPEVSIQGWTKDGKRLVVIFSLKGPYLGEWYKFPPDYTSRNGIGFRTDPVLGDVIDVLIREDAKIPLGLKVVSDN